MPTGNGGFISSNGEKRKKSTRAAGGGRCNPCRYGFSAFHHSIGEDAEVRVELSSAAEAKQLGYLNLLFVVSRMRVGVNEAVKSRVQSGSAYCSFDGLMA